MRERKRKKELKNCVRFLLSPIHSFEDVSMDGNQNSNPLDYSQSGVVYKDLNGNGTASSNIKSNESFVDQNGIKSPSNTLGQVTKMKICARSRFPFTSIPRTKFHSQKTSKK